MALHHEWASDAPLRRRPTRRPTSRPSGSRSKSWTGAWSPSGRNPRDSFAGHHADDTPWDPLQRGYFNGYALWTYLTSPFLLALPGFSVRELDPVEDNGRDTGGAASAFPGRNRQPQLACRSSTSARDLPATHATTTASMWPADSATIQYISDFTEADGIRRAHQEAGVPVW